MTESPVPPTWKLPRGVNASLWQYAHTPRLADEEDGYFDGHLSSGPIAGWWTSGSANPARSSTRLRHRPPRDPVRQSRVPGRRRRTLQRDAPDRRCEGGD